MTLEQVDLEVLLLDRQAVAHAGARRGHGDDTIEAAVQEAMGGAR